MFGLLSSRYVGALGMIAISTKLLSLVACEDIKNADSDIEFIGKLSMERLNQDDKSTKDSRLKCVVKVLGKKDVKGTVFLMENAEPKSTGWSELGEVFKNVDTKEKKFTDASDHGYTLTDKRYYCMKLCTSDDKSYYSAVYTYEKGRFTSTPTIDDKTGGKKLGFFTLLYAVIVGLAIFILLMFFAVHVTK
ncbi:hypothetical protein PAEPH01_0228 [Pancytospora epiphaga]|nr:hypothetical protein PAEPH01_0228 [Pancytospora epiphaga]